MSLLVDAGVAVAAGDLSRPVGHDELLFDEDGELPSGQDRDDGDYGLPEGWPENDPEYLRLIGVLPPLAASAPRIAPTPAAEPPSASGTPLAPSPAAAAPSGPSERGITDVAHAALDAIVTEFSEIERERARWEARRATLLDRGQAWAARFAADVAGTFESTGRRRDLAHRAMIAELAAAVRMSERTLAAQVERAAALVAHPAVHDALAAGTISVSHASVIVEEADSLTPIEGEAPDAALVRDFEERLLIRAATSAPGEVRRSARRWREKVLPESISVRHERAFARRRAWVEPLDDAMSCLHVIAPCDRIALINAEVTSEAVRLRDDEHDGRTVEQLRCDLIVGRLLVSPDALGSMGSDASVVMGMGEKRSGTSVLPSMRVLVTVPVLTLAGLSDEPGQLDGHGPIPPEMARRLVSHAPALTRILTHPVTGSVLDVDATVYKVSAALRTWLQLRDGTCRFMGCLRKAVSCDTDHTVAWEHGGHTSHDNLAHLCRKHHRLKHGTGWSVEQKPGGVLEWRSPTGRTYRTDRDEPPPGSAGPE